MTTANLGCAYAEGTTDGPRAEELGAEVSISQGLLPLPRSVRIRARYTTRFQFGFGGGGDHSAKNPFSLDRRWGTELALGDLRVQAMVDGLQTELSAPTSRVDIPTTLPK